MQRPAMARRVGSISSLKVQLFGRTLGLGSLDPPGAIQREVSATVSTLMDKAYMLVDILAFLGAKHYLFLATVSKPFSSAFAIAFGSREKQTSYASVFESAQRLRVAVQCGFLKLLNVKAVAECAGVCASKETMLAARKHGMQLGDNVLNGALSRARFPEIRWLISRRGHMLPLDATAAAARSGSVEMMSYLMRQNAAVHARTLYEAAVNDHLPLVQFLRQADCPWPADVAPNVARNGNFPLLRWIVESGCPFDADRVAEFAVHSDSVEILQWLHTDRAVQFGDCHLRRAITLGALAAVKFLVRDCGCALDEQHTLVSARHAQFEVFLWLVKSAKCPWQSCPVVEAAIQRDSHRIFDYALDHCSNGQVPDMRDLLVRSCNAGALKCAGKLYSRGAKWPRRVDFSAWTSEVTEWAREHSRMLSTMARLRA